MISALFKFLHQCETFAVQICEVVSVPRRNTQSGCSHGRRLYGTCMLLLFRRRSVPDDVGELSLSPQTHLQPLNHVGLFQKKIKGATSANQPPTVLTPHHRRRVAASYRDEHRCEVVPLTEAVCDSWFHTGTESRSLMSWVPPFSFSARLSWKQCLHASNKFIKYTSCYC